MSKVLYEICEFTKAKIPEIAELLETVWKSKENAITSDRWISWLENLEFDFPPMSISASINGSLIGWILYAKQSPTEIEINPWALGGHPITLAEYDSTFEISKLLLEKVTSFAKEQGIRKLEVLFNVDDQTSENYETFYQSINFTHLDSSNHLRKTIPTIDDKIDTLSNSFKTNKVSESNQEDLLACFLDVFADTNDPWMKEKSKDELSEYFKHQLIKGAFPNVDDASITITKGEKMIGFSIVKESHGEKNGNIWIIGVHPDYRRKKIGTGIFSYVTNTLRNLDFKTISLNVSSFNLPAYQLYLKLGFEISWTQLNYVWKT